MPGNEKWTDEQKSVIESRKQSLLVSAAAGSGKTAVLVQRIMDQILDPVRPVDIDHMLIVTFTNAAAGQLREKIRGKLEETMDLAAQEGNEALADAASRQLALLSGDHIETIDRFCREVVLDHASLAGVDPSFRIGDEGEMKLLKSDAAAQAIEEAYGSQDASFAEDFREFSGLYAPGRTDGALEAMIVQFYEFSQSHPFPSIWRRECVQNYREDPDESLWMESMLSAARKKVSELREMNETLLCASREEGGPYHYIPALEGDADLLDSLHACRRAQDFYEALQHLSWVGLGRKKKNGPDVDAAKETYVKDCRNMVKAEVKKLAEGFFWMDPQEAQRLTLESARYMDALVRITDEFERVYASMKAERNIEDFSDVAHQALRLLICTDETGAPLTDEEGQYIRTQIAEEYAAYYDQICIDEYQDSNRVQEVLLWSVSRAPQGAWNRFMVGDVKQSIYGFRMADPGIFNEKAHRYPTREDAPERRIDLHVNFRSRRCVIDAVNLIFRQVMRADVGGIEYDEREMLRQGYPYPEDAEEMLPELVLVERSDVPGAKDKIAAEAEITALRISQIVGKLQIFDQETLEERPASYGDIVILLRTASGWEETFSRILTEHGIPNRAGGGKGYFDAREVRVILAYLNVLDNPRQDIPLAAVLRSEIGGLDDSQLSKIRILGGDESFCDCVLHYMECGEEEEIRQKLISFMEMTEALRQEVKDTPIHLLLWKIFDLTGYADLAAASPNGEQKRANLDLLVDKAIAYESTSYKGLFHFIRYIEKLRKGDVDFGPARVVEGGTDEVRIMTMHASKGLEFPVTFVCGLGKKFNQQDARGSVVLQNALGAGMDYVDSQTRVKTPLPVKKAIADRICREETGEELRILYVAMTRAQQKLILTGCVDDRAAYLQNISKKCSVRTEKLSYTSVLGVSCMLDWVVMALMRHEKERGFFEDPAWDLPPLIVSPVQDAEGCVRIRAGEAVMQRSAERTLLRQRKVLDLAHVDTETVYDEALHAHLEKMLSARRQERSLGGMPGKLSVSRIKHEAYEAEIRRLEEEAAPVRLEDAAPARSEDTASERIEGAAPAQESGEEGSRRREKSLSGSDRGTAYHEVMAFADFTSDPEKGQIAAQLESMVNCDRIQSDEARSVNPEKIERFMNSPLAGRMRSACREGNLWREQPFVIGMKGSSIRSDWSSEETLLVQGIIDAFFVEEDHVVLIDYKTDHARPGDEESLVNRYRKQFELYRDALERLLQKSVTEAWLYSFSLEKAIRVPL